MSYCSGWGFASEPGEMGASEIQKEYLVKLCIDRAIIEGFGFHSKLRITGDYDTTSLRLLKGTLTRKFESVLLFFDDAEENPRELHIFSIASQPTAKYIKSLTRLDIEISHISSISMLSLDPSILSKCLINYIYQQVLLLQNWSSFATDTQEDGVLIDYHENESVQNVVSLINIVIDGSTTAFLSLNTARYRVNRLDFNSLLGGQTLLPLNRQLIVIAPSASHLSSLGSSNTRQGYQQFLPSSNDQCREYYSSLYGFNIPEVDNKVVLMEVKDENVLQVLPAALLVSSCVELSIQSVRLGNEVALLFTNAIKEIMIKNKIFVSADLDDSTAQVLKSEKFVSIPVILQRASQLKRKRVPTDVDCVVKENECDFGDCLFDERPLTKTT